MHILWAAVSGVHVPLAQPAFCLSRYFPAASTREMLDEWRPLLCVFDGVMQKAISNMELFLPTITPPEEHGQAFRSASAWASGVPRSRLLPAEALSSLAHAGLTASLSLHPLMGRAGWGRGFRFVCVL